MDQKKMMGFDDPGAQRVAITVRNWDALKLAIWRSKVAWEITARAATEILTSCKHKDGCPALHDETAPCLGDRYEKLNDAQEASLVEKGCPDRETRMSALVILGAGIFAPVDARRGASERFFSPGREYFSEVMAELAAAQAENEALYAALAAAGVEAPAPPPRAPDPILPARRTPPRLAPSTVPKEST